MRVFVFILFISLSQYLFAQVGKAKFENGLLKQNFIGVTIGAAFPLGDFADKTITNLPAGYANIGYSIDVSLKIALSQSLGISLGYISCNNSFDANTYQQDYNSYYAKMSNQGFAPPKYLLGLTSNNWLLKGGTIMPVYILKASKLNIEIGVGGGIFIGTYPYQTITYTPIGGGTSYAKIQTESDALNWGLRGSIATHYKLFSNFIVSAQVDYYYTDMTFKIQNTDYKQPFRILSLSAGIGYQFD